jgi:hypothetical protein
MEIFMAKAKQPSEIVSYKGFDKDLKCREYQFEIGKTYTHDGDVEQCASGFHACPVEHHPFSVFEFYPPAGSRFCEVRQSGATSNGGTKLASAVITIGVELTIHDLVKRAWEYVWSRATKSDENHSTGNYGAASSTGYQGAASSTGNQGAASSTGYQGAASSTGNYGAASSTGTQGAASSTGYQGAASSTGNQGAASSTGYQGAASSTGNYGAASSTGNYGAASSTGYQGAAMASGYEGRVMGADGNALFAVERGKNYKIVSVAAGIVGQDGIKANVWYTARSGKLVEAA